MLASTFSWASVSPSVTWAGGDLGSRVPAPAPTPPRSPPPPALRGLLAWNLTAIIHPGGCPAPLAQGGGPRSSQNWTPPWREGGGWGGSRRSRCPALALLPPAPPPGLHLHLFLLCVPSRPRLCPDTPPGRLRSHHPHPSQHRIQALGWEFQAGFSTQLRTSRRPGWRPARRGCKEDQAGIKAAFGTEPALWKVFHPG